MLCCVLLCAPAALLAPAGRAAEAVSIYLLQRPPARAALGRCLAGFRVFQRQIADSLRPRENPCFGCCAQKVFTRNHPTRGEAALLSLPNLNPSIHGHPTLLQSLPLCLCTAPCDQLISSVVVA